MKLFWHSTEGDRILSAFSQKGEQLNILAVAGSGQILDYVAKLGKKLASIDLLDLNPLQLALVHHTIELIKISPDLESYYLSWKTFPTKFKGKNKALAPENCLDKRINSGLLFQFERSNTLYCQLNETLSTIKIKYFKGNIMDLGNLSPNKQYHRVYLSNALPKKGNLSCLAQYVTLGGEIVIAAPEMNLSTILDPINEFKKTLPASTKKQINSPRNSFPPKELTKIYPKLKQYQQRQNTLLNKPILYTKIT